MLYKERQAKREASRSKAYPGFEVYIVQRGRKTFSSGHQAIIISNEGSNEGYVNWYDGKSETFRIGHQELFLPFKSPAFAGYAKFEVIADNTIMKVQIRR